MAYATKEKERENKKIYYINNREVILNRAKEWNKNNRERINARRKNKK